MRAGEERGKGRNDQKRHRSHFQEDDIIMQEPSLTVPQKDKKACVSLPPGTMWGHTDPEVEHHTGHAAHHVPRPYKVGVT